jgi:uncharacterized Fe-S cluster-containing radical SAM superfamily protein
MEEHIYRTIELENNQTLVIHNESRGIAAEASVVLIVARMNICVQKDLFVSEKITDTQFADIQGILGEFIVYEYKSERNMIMDHEKDQVFEDLVETFLKNMVQYISRPKFPGKLVLKEYRERIEKEKKYSRK